MKKNIIKTAIAGLALAAVFTGCFNPVNLADTKNEVEKYNDNKVVNDVARTNGSVSASGTLYVGAATKDLNKITVTFTSRAGVSKDMVKESFAIYGLKDNPTNKNYPAVLDAALAYEIVDFYESGTSTTVTTTAILNVNAASYKGPKVVAKADATKLKDIKGSFLLNGDGNETAGEATDSYQSDTDITVAKADASVTLDTLTSTQVMPVRLTGTLSIASYGEKYNEDLTKLEGIEFVTSIAPVKAYDANNKIVYCSDLAATLASVYKVEKIAPGENKWTPVSLTFTYDDTNKVMGTVVPVYRALLSIDSIPVGTQWRVVMTKDPNVSIANEYYGIPYVMTYSKKTTYSVAEISGNEIKGTSNYYSKDTTTIVGTTSTKNFFEVTDTAVTTAQAGYFTVTKSALNKDGKGVRYEISWTKEMKSYTDFIVVYNDTMKKVAVNAPIVLAKDNDKEFVKSIAIETTDCTFMPNEVSLYVGSGVELKENTTIAAQVKFGTGYADWSKFDASGYVKLN